MEHLIKRNKEKQGTKAALCLVQRNVLFQLSNDISRCAYLQVIGSLLMFPHNLVSIPPFTRQL